MFHHSTQFHGNICVIQLSIKPTQKQTRPTKHHYGGGCQTSKVCDSEIYVMMPVDLIFFYIALFLLSSPPYCCVVSTGLLMNNDAQLWGKGIA